MDGSLVPQTMLPLLRSRFGRPYEHVESTPSTQLLVPADAPEVRARSSATTRGSAPCADGAAAVPRQVDLVGRDSADGAAVADPQQARALDPQLRPASVHGDDERAGFRDPQRDRRERDQ